MEVLGWFFRGCVGWLFFFVVWSGVLGLGVLGVLGLLGCFGEDACRLVCVIV